MLLNKFLGRITRRRKKTRRRGTSNGRLNVTYGNLPQNEN